MSIAVRDHRSAPAVRDHRTSHVEVRDHRMHPTVRDHRMEGFDRVPDRSRLLGYRPESPAQSLFDRTLARFRELLGGGLNVDPRAAAGLRAVASAQGVYALPS